MWAQSVKRFGARHIAGASALPKRLLTADAHG